MRASNMHNETCVSIYRTLLELLKERPTADTAVLYVRELQETSMCDDLVSLAPLRAKVANIAQTTVGGSLGRILIFQETERDRYAATHAFVHYRHEHRQALYNAIGRCYWKRAWFRRQ